MRDENVSRGGVQPIRHSQRTFVYKELEWLRIKEEKYILWAIHDVSMGGGNLRKSNKLGTVCIALGLLLPPDFSSYLTTQHKITFV